MSNNILVFSTVEEAISILKNFKIKFIYEYNNLDKQAIIAKSVDSSIFRAFRNLKVKPSVIYRQWSSSNFNSIIEKSKKATSQNQFDSLVDNLTILLIKYWNNKVDCSNSKLGYGPASKMINLLFKSFQESNNFRIERIQKYLNVPFDEYSLKPLQNVINDLTSVDFKITIPQNPTMRFITTPDLYFIITRAVRSLCRKAEIYPIIYDYWSWNDKH